MLPDPGANDRAAGQRTRATCLAAGNILHVSGYSLLRPGSRAAALVAMDRARDAGMRISVDPASAPRCCSTIPRLPRPRARPIDLLLPNEDEFAALGGA